MGTAVGRFYRRAFTRQPESIVNLELDVRRAPRPVLSLNRGFVKLGAFTRNKLRQTPLSNPNLERAFFNSEEQDRPGYVRTGPARIARDYTFTA